MRPSRIRLLSVFAAGALVACAGCASSLFRSDDADRALNELSEKEVPLVGDVAHPWGLRPEKVEAVALVTGLRGTGEDPPQSPQRAVLIDEMNRRDVSDPNEVLRSPDTALVLLRGYILPGASKGDKFDVEVRTPSRSNAKSLRGGWAMESRLTKLAALGGRIREGRVLAMAEGPILVDPSSDVEDETAATLQGRILGGGVVLKGRDLGLLIAEQHQSPRMSSMVAAAVNKRFESYFDGRKQGVAEPKDFGYVTLRVHPRYKDNIGRFVRVVRAIALREDSTGRQERVELLGAQLLDPLTAATAALRLEAIGGETAILQLRQGLESSDAEVRFYAAEALAYLDQTDCVAALADAARDERAFRWHAMTALSAMDDVVAYEALRSLLAGKSAETRYGAFRSLRAMNASDPLVRGEQLGGSFAYHVLNVDGPDMVHVTRSGRPEIVLFGGDQKLKLPMVLDAGEILVNGLAGEEVTVSRFRAGGQTTRRTVSNEIDRVVRAIVEVGGEYPDVVQALQQAKRDGALEGRLAVDAVPRLGRVYDKDDDQIDQASDEAVADEETDSTGAPADEAYRVATPVPDLFSSTGR